MAVNTRRAVYLKVFFSLCLIGALLFAAVLWQANRIVAHLLQPYVESRAGSLEIEHIRVQSEGLSVRIADYSEPGFTVSGLGIQLPWSSLLHYKDSLSLSIEGASLQVDGSVFEAPSTSDPLPLATRFANASESIERVFVSIAEAIESSPVHSFDAQINQVVLTWQELTFTAALDSSMDTGAADVVITLGLKNEELSLKTRMRVANQGETIGIDFSSSAYQWEHWLAKYAPDFERWLLDQALDVYLSPWEAGRFVDISGYARWESVRPNELRAALLGNAVAMEIFSNQGELATKPMAFGLATNGHTLSRAYWNLPLASIRAGSWQAQQGELGLHMENQAVSARLQLDDAELSVKSVDWLEWLGGDGEVEYEAAVPALSSSMIQALVPGTLPFDLSFAGAFHSSGRLYFEDGLFHNAAAEVDWQLARLDWPSKSLALTGFSGKVQLDSCLNQLPQGQGALQIEQMQVAGIDFAQFATTVQTKDGYNVLVDEFKVQTMGGTARTEAFALNWQKRTSDSIGLALRQIDLAELAKVVPQFKGTVTGAASGDLQLSVSSSSLRLIGGALSLDKDMPAHLSYPMNGLLTNRLVPGTAAYKQYQMAERALEDLSLERLKIDFFPDGNPAKPVVLTFFGESQQEGTFVPIDYTLNVNVDDSAGLIQLLQMMQQGNLDIR